MGSVYEKCMNLYPHVLFVGLIILCRLYDISYIFALGYLLDTLVNCGLKLFFYHTIGPAGNRPIPYHPAHPLHDVFGRKIEFIECANGYGFPSGHAQSVGYSLAFAHQFLPWRSWHPAWVVAAVLAAAWLVWTRIAFKRHTVTQVLFGLGFGIAFFRAFHWVVGRSN